MSDSLRSTFLISVPVMFHFVSVFTRFPEKSKSRELNNKENKSHMRGYSCKCIDCVDCPLICDVNLVLSETRYTNLIAGDYVHCCVIIFMKLVSLANA